MVGRSGRAVHPEQLLGRRESGSLVLKIVRSQRSSSHCEESR